MAFEIPKSQLLIPLGEFCLTALFTIFIKTPSDEISFGRMLFIHPAQFQTHIRCVKEQS